MTMTKGSERLPRPAAELEQLAEYYDTHDTSAEMEPGHWVEPQPMATTSLRLPVEVIDQLKRQARSRHLRYTSYVRSILERAARDGTSPEIADITERLERIERAVTERQSPGDQKTALQAATQVAVLDDGLVTTREVTPDDAGLRRWPLAEITGGNAAHNAARLKALLDGEQGPYRDIVLLNASGALVVAGRAKDVKEGVAKAAQALDSGAARAKLNALISASNRPASNSEATDH